MTNKNYQMKLKEYATKKDKNYQAICENLPDNEHKMFVERENIEKLFQDSFNAVKEDYLALEKVDLIDYWENGEWTDK
ncbi:MAG: hypothetical protein IJX25_01420 [Clostridia bacterium]|nr:hypothetical protein [Clostridia bacterium]MBQ8792029.1 hypothetical protein [Clostridia bacterium]